MKTKKKRVVHLNRRRQIYQIYDGPYNNLYRSLNNWSYDDKYGQTWVYQCRDTHFIDAAYEQGRRDEREASS